MILTEIRDYIKERQLVSLSDLKLHFKTSSDEMRGMLSQWMKKGKVVKHETPSGGCHGCKSCSCHEDDAMEMYGWNV